MEQNRLGSGGLCPAVQTSLEEHIAYLQQQIEKTRRQIKAHIDQAPDLKQQAKLLESIPGIGAAMRKLLHLALGVLKSGVPFDPAFCSQNT